MLFVSGFQATQNRARHRRRPIGQPLPDGQRVDVVQAAGVDDDLHPLQDRDGFHVSVQLNVTVSFFNLNVVVPTKLKVQEQNVQEVLTGQLTQKSALCHESKLK